jgi:prenyltransferase beta subunit
MKTDWIAGRLFCSISLLILVGGCFVSSCRGEELIGSARRQAVRRGLERLVADQHDDGSFGSGHLRGNVAITAFGASALVASGSTPGRGPYGDRIDRAIDYLISHAQPSGFIVNAKAASHGPMYGHGFATLFLAEMLGEARQPKLREVVGRAVELILRCQNEAGGWRYQPVRGDADISVTTCQVMALRAAHNGGIDVPASAINRAVDYIKGRQNPDGGFKYSLDGTEPSLFPRSAAAISSLYCAGIYDGPVVERGLGYLEKFRPKPGKIDEMTHYYYGQYYAMGLFWQTGPEAGREWYVATSDDLLARQNPDGSWSSVYTDAYATAIACIILQMPESPLPIFQR